MSKTKKITIEDIFELSDFFKFFGDSTRIRIINVLRKGELSVQAISDELELGQSTISHQLRILRIAHLVSNRREGKVVYYSLDDDHIEQIFQIGMEHILHKREKRKS